MRRILDATFDPEETTRPDMHSEAVRRLRGNGSNEEEIGGLMVAVARLEKQCNEGFAQFRTLNGRLGRIERMLYGGVGTVLLALAQYIAAKLGVHLAP